MKCEIPFTAWGLITIEANSQIDAVNLVKKAVNSDNHLYDKMVKAALKDVDANGNITFNQKEIQPGDVGTPIENE